MQRKTLVALSAMGLTLCVGSAYGQNKSEGNSLKANPPMAGTADQNPLRLAAYQEKPATTSEKTTIKTTETTIGGDFKGLSGFFNVREANSNVGNGAWEMEMNSFWSTGNGGDDDVGAGLLIRHGLSDATHIDLALIPINFGDGGGQGAGELALTLFHQCTTEADAGVAIGTWATVRIPTGDGSEGVDGKLATAITKTLGGNWRGHINGYVMTANGEMGDPDDDGGDDLSFDGHSHGSRRDFQWGVGVGLDYQCSADTIGTINWINRSNDQNGENNDNIIELGLSHKLADNQGLKFAVDVDVDGADESIPNVGAKLQWSIAW